MQCESCADIGCCHDDNAQHQSRLSPAAVPSAALPTRTRSETIRVELVYNVHAAARELDELYKLTQQTIEGAAHRHGWVKWVKIERKDYPQTEDFKDRLGCPQS